MAQSEIIETSKAQGAPQQGQKSLFSPLRLRKILYMRAVHRVLFARDALNRIRYGPVAPVHAERIWVTPSQCLGLPLILGKQLGFGWYGSAKVISHWPVGPGDLLDIRSVRKIRQCIEHWENGKSWEETGAYDDYLDRGYPLEKVIKRHEMLDKLFISIRSEKKLKTSKDVSRNAFREELGVRINIGPNWEMLFCDGGAHRLAMSLILNFSSIPAQVGFVHVKGIDALPHLRRKVAVHEHTQPELERSLQ